MRKPLVFLIVAVVLGMTAALVVPSKPDPMAKNQSQPTLTAVGRWIPATTGRDPAAPTPDAPATPTTPAPSTPTTPAPTTPSTPAPAPSPQPTPQPSGRYRDGTYYGNTVSNQYENVQVSIVVTGNRITNINVVTLETSSQKSAQVTSGAIPKLHDEAISAQSASIANVSGATYISRSYKQTLQSAIDQAYL